MVSLGLVAIIWVSERGFLGLGVGCWGICMDGRDEGDVCLWLLRTRMLRRGKDFKDGF